VPVQRLSRHKPALALLPAALAAGWAGAWAAGEGRRPLLAFIIAGATLCVPVYLALRRRVGAGLLAVEVPVLLMLLSNLVWRSRTSASLLNNPLDAAGQLRVVLVGIAGILAAAALLTSYNAARQLITVPFWLYALYAVVVCAGVPLSVEPKLTAYRAAELITVMVVLMGAMAATGPAAMARIGRLLYWFTAVLLIVIWLEAVLLPSKGFQELADTSIPVGWNLAGVYPSVAPNSVGFLGVVLAAWSLTAPPNWPSGRPLRPAMARALVALGVASVLASQYRTGYVAMVATAMVWMLVGRRWLAAAFAAAAACAVLLWNPSLPGNAAPYVLRGQSTEQAGQLSGRVEWWQASIPVWQESPLLGRGLLTATRFEVFAKLGLDKVAGVHSTWVEALVGTGLIGAGLLATAFLITLWRAFALARAPTPELMPLLLLTALAVRSITGNTFESFQYESMLFLWLALTTPIAGGQKLGSARPT
jgi:O-antigen ligase